MGDPIVVRMHHLEGNMKQILVLSALATSILLLAGCSSSSSRFAKKDKFEIDHEYVAAVSHAGRQQGVRITWINPPTKKVESKSEIND